MKINLQKDGRNGFSLTGESETDDDLEEVYAIVEGFSEVLRKAAEASRYLAEKEDAPLERRMAVEALLLKLRLLNHMLEKQATMIELVMSGTISASEAGFPEFEDERYLDN